MGTINETITLNGNTGLTVDVTRIEYKDGFHGPTWITANIPSAELRTLCGKDGKGRFVTTEDEVEVALTKWLTRHFGHEVASFLWMWDTYLLSEVA